MRVFYDDDERALLAARLGHAPEVNDRRLAASFEAWVNGTPTERNGDRGRRRSVARKLTARDVDHLRAVVDWTDESGGYRSQTDWLGVG